MPAQDLVLGSGLRYIFYKHNRANDIFFALNNLHLTTNFLLNQSPHNQFYSQKSIILIIVRAMQGVCLFVPYRKRCLATEAERNENVATEEDVQLKPEREPETTL